MNLDVTFRPIDRWPSRLRDPGERKASPFTAPWSDTLHLLERELRQLDAHTIIVQVALRETQIRRDGWPKSGAAAPEHPGVILAFASKHGPLKYATDLFTRYEDNLRAIALGLDSLRRVDRYGITERGEQYTGWKALPPGHADMQLAERGAELVEKHGSIKAALMATHPDHGGDSDDFRAVRALQDGS